jgi:CO/xanthine dehydrogenase Mo-binding subunit
MAKYSVINTHVHNVDGIAKVTGRAIYTFDVKLPGMLYGKILRSPHAHARILNIDYGKALSRGYYTPHRKGMISPAYSYMLQAVEVEIDKETGKIKLIDSLTAHDCGQPINRLGLTGQLEGAFSMAAGYGYLEYMPYEDGKLMNPNLVDYKVMRATEMPEVPVAEIRKQAHPD